jgi:phosphohistidine phosphatase
MELYLLRHGEAEGAAGVSDEQRALTPRGIESLRQVLAIAREKGAAPSAAFTSPLRRAVQTARLAEEILGGGPPVVLNALALARWPDELWDEVSLHAGRQPVLLTGHNPLLAGMVEWLTGQPAAMPTAALASIEIPEPGIRPRGSLRWLVTPVAP